MPLGVDFRLSKTLQGLEESKISIVEWEKPLLIHSAYPLVTRTDLIYLVPDDQIQLANNIAVASGLRLTKDYDFPKLCLTEHAKQGTRHAYGNPESRFILALLSWTGIERDELSIIAPANELLPCTIWIVPLPSFCAAYLRIIMQESTISRVRIITNADLSGVIACSMFDMTYEGSYMRTPEDDPDDDHDEVVPFRDDKEWEEKDALEIRNALCKIRGWHFKRKDEWLRDMLIELVSGNLRYETLPSRETQSC
ncbi:hypothetical protein CGCTS75_v008741 [Colletotrichum tropicale]|nr:hypothetical protein CGCTS75_v008741 [Colletotrichum tropicale]